MRKLSVLLLVCIIGCKLESAPDARAVVSSFYATTMSNKLSGAPTAQQLDSIAPYLSDTLRALLAGARRLNEADVARAPDEKPAFAEGDLFSSSFEGATNAEFVADSARGDLRVATVRMTYNAATPAVTWVDHVVLKRQGAKLVIDDIEYGATWDFANKGTLRHALESALSTATR